MRCATASRSGWRCISARNCRCWCGVLDHVSRRLADIRPVNVKDVAHVTLQVLNHRLDPHQVEKVRQALPENIRALWPTGTEGRRFEPAA
jgi:hypothetical protein